MLQWFRNLGRKAVKNDLSPSEVERLVTDFAAVLEQSDGFLQDAANLPAPKEVLVRALIIAGRSTADPEQRDALKAALLTLSSFRVLQPGEIEALRTHKAAKALLAMITPPADVPGRDELMMHIGASEQFREAVRTLSESSKVVLRLQTGLKEELQGYNAQWDAEVG